MPEFLIYRCESVFAANIIQWPYRVKISLATSQLKNYIRQPSYCQALVLQFTKIALAGIIKTFGATRIILVLAPS